jgi:mycofactocin precursor
MLLDKESTMTDRSTPVTDEPVPDSQQDEVLIAEEVLVEEVSIDGMCGVY